MLARAWPAVCAAALTMHCAPAVDELPDVKTPVALGEPCVDLPRAITLSDVPSLTTTDVASCVSTAWSSRCDGSMSFEVDVDESGRARDLRFEGDASPELRRCIRDALAHGVRLPQAPCALQATTTVRGGIRWPSDGGTQVYLAGDSAILPCLRRCTAGEGPSGPTRGCT